MKMSISSFREFALTRSEMKSVKGGCMPAHYDIWVHNGKGSKKNNGNFQVACVMTEKSAVKAIHKNYGTGIAVSYTYNSGTC